MLERPNDLFLLIVDHTAIAHPRAARTGRYDVSKWVDTILNRILEFEEESDLGSPANFVVSCEKNKYCE